MVEAYPLQWPPGWSRTERRPIARFKVRFAQARDEMLREIHRMGGRHIVVSSNVELRRDGLPYANKKNPDDPGVAVYFELKGEQVCFPCDRWYHVEDNVRAIGKSIEALRGIERWGGSDMVNASFKGFEQLPHDLRARTFYFKECLGKEEIDTKFKKLVKDLHPDMGGDEQEFIDMKEQYDQLMGGIE